ncbi:hypothetical protein [Pseudomonas sp. TE3610]
MTRSTLRTCARRALPALLILQLALLTGCAGDPSRCYAKALPTQGEGSLAWGPSLSAASKKSLANCKTYAERSGGTPRTCKVVLMQCKS